MLAADETFAFFMETARCLRITVLAVLRFGAPTTILAAPKPAPSASPSATPAPDYAAEVARLKTADELFDYIMTIDSGGHKFAMSFNVNIEANTPPAAVDAQSNKFLDDERARLRPAVKTFLERYPKDPRRSDVQLQLLLFSGDADYVSDEKSLTMLKAIAAAPDASADTRHHVRSLLLGNELGGIDPKRNSPPK